MGEKREIRFGFFCAGERDPRRQLWAPFVSDFEGKTAATNGRVMIITDDPMPVIKGDPEDGREPPEIGRIIKDALNATSIEEIAIEGLPHPHSIRQRECPDCGASGEISFRIGRYSYECECKRCDGYQIVPRSEDSEPIAVGESNRLFPIYYLCVLATLPGCQLFIRPQGEEEKLHLFRFDGGFGAVMPAKARESDDEEGEIDLHSSLPIRSLDQVKAEMKAAAPA